MCARRSVRALQLVTVSILGLPAFLQDVSMSVKARKPSDIIASYSVSTTAMALSLIVYGCFPKQAHHLLEKPFLVALAGALASIATFADLASGSVVAVALTGVFTSFLAARFSLQLAQVNPKTAMLACCASQILASFIYGYILALPTFWRPLFLCLLPAIAGGCSLIDGGKLSYDVKSLVKTKGLYRPMMRFIVAIFVFSIAINVVRGFYPSMIELDTFAEARGSTSVLFFFVKMVICLFIIFLPTKTNLSRLCYYSFLVLAFVTLPLPLMGLGSSETLQLFGCVNALLNLMVWTLLSAIAYKSGRSPVRLFGWGWGGMSLGSVAGWLIGMGLFVGGVESSAITVVEIIIIGVMLICCIFVVNMSVIRHLFVPVDEAGEDVDVSIGDVGEKGDGKKPSGEIEADKAQAGMAGDDAAAAPQEGYRKAVLVALSSDFGLSDREVEVLNLLVRGYSKNRVSEELFISYNTVRSHVRNIYTKLDVHSQQDLIELFESYYSQK